MERDVAHLLTSLYVIEKGPCEMSTNALRQKSIRNFFNSGDYMHSYSFKIKTEFRFQIVLTYVNHCFHLKVQVQLLQT